METRPLFDLNLNRNFSFEWFAKSPPLYKGLLLPQASLRCISGSFGDMLYQYYQQKKYSIWYSNYDIRRRIVTQANLDRPMIELSLIMDPAKDFSLAPFGRLAARKWQFNLLYQTQMDSRVQFDSFTRATSLDVHIELSLLEAIFESFPDLVAPFLEAIHATSPMLYYPEYIYATPEMVHTVHRILQLLGRPQSSELLMEFLVSLLLVQAMELKTSDRYCKMPYDQVLQLRKVLNCGIRLALMDLSKFHGYDYYAKHCLMSPTTFKKYMRQVNGTTLWEIWEDVRLVAVLDEVTSSQKLLEDIALEYGFFSMTGFKGAFRRKMGLPPQALR